MFTQLLVGIVFELIINQSYGSSMPFRRKEMIGKIVGGVPVDINKFPHGVQVYNKRNNKLLMCAGSILNAYTVLSAAHCFDYTQDVSSVEVISGARFFYDSKGLLHRVKLLVIHERYNISRFLACDIALVFLENPIKFSKVAQKAVIVNTEKWMSEKETEFFVTGWGNTENEGDFSKDGLLMAQMRYISLDKCRKLYKMHFTDEMFCLYGDGVRGTCKGDSGGGVIWRDMIVGITSHGQGCAMKDRPNIYTNVWYFRNWIEKQIDEFAANFCEITTKKHNLDDYWII